MDKNRMMLTDSQWYQIEKLLLSQAGKQGRPRNRLVIEGILWILRTGARDLPKREIYQKRNLVLGQQFMEDGVIGY